MITREDIVAAARVYLNAPFKYAGRSKRGIDCIGLALVIPRDLKMACWPALASDRELHAYPKVRPPGFMKGKLSDFCQRGLLRRFDPTQAKGGDLVLCFGLLGSNHEHHVCILTGKTTLIEARQSKEPGFPQGRVVECDILPSNRRAFMAAYQFSEVA